MCQVGLTTKEPLERQWEYHLGLASALHSSGRLAEARAQLCQSVRRDWSPLQHATLLAQLSDVLVRRFITKILTPAACHDQSL